MTNQISHSSNSMQTSYIIQKAILIPYLFFPFYDKKFHFLFLYIHTHLIIYTILLISTKLVRQRKVVQKYFQESPYRTWWGRRSTCDPFHQRAPSTCCYDILRNPNNNFVATINQGRLSTSNYPSKCFIHKVLQAPATEAGNSLLDILFVNHNHDYKRKTTDSTKLLFFLHFCGPKH